jgi:hypothetical protein
LRGGRTRLTDGAAKGGAELQKTESILKPANVERISRPARKNELDAGRRPAVGFAHRVLIRAIAIGVVAAFAGRAAAAAVRLAVLKESLGAFHFARAFAVGASSHRSSSLRCEKKGAAFAAPLCGRQILGALRPRTKNTSANTNATTNKIQAMFAEIPAIPEKPSTPATSATIKKINA